MNRYAKAEHQRITLWLQKIPILHTGKSEPLNRQITTLKGSQIMVTYQLWDVR